MFSCDLVFLLFVIDFREIFINVFIEVCVGIGVVALFLIGIKGKVDMYINMEVIFVRRFKRIK